jgi:TRAP transporter 4TM/12TM fusion protein
VKAAAIPALLYYAALFAQVHFYAGRHGLVGMDKSLLPRIVPVLKSGWPYLLAMALLVFFIYRQEETQAPFYASVALLAVSVLKGDVKFNVQNLLDLVRDVGMLIVEVVAVLVACGFILGAFSMTGLGSSFAREIVALAGKTPILLLVCGALASYILGMGMTITACYIFLAAILAPALVNTGFSTIGSHLFVLYWGLASFITPPVAIGAYVAAGLAGANAMRTGMTAMRLGLVLYVIPFVFMYQPALILDAPVAELPRVLLTTVLGLTLIAGGFEGYISWFHRVSTWERAVLFVAGVLLLIPEFYTDFVGLVLAIALVLSRLWRTARTHRAHVRAEPRRESS